MSISSSRLRASCCSLIFLAAGPALAQPAAESHHATFQFVNAHWYTGNGFTPGTRFVANGTFVPSVAGEADTVIDLHGAYVLPPFGDAHNHLVCDNQNPDAQIARCLQAGIFYLKNPNSTYRFTEPLLPKVNTEHSLDVSYSFGGLTASGGHPVQLYNRVAEDKVLPVSSPKELENEAYYLIDSERDLQDKWPQILAKSPGFIKIYLEHSEEYEKRHDDPAYFGKRGLDPALVAPIVARAHAAGLRVSAHVSTSADFHCAVEAGVDEVNHLPLAPISREDARLAASRKTVVVTTVLSHRPSDGIADLDQLHRDNIRLLHESGVTLTVGVDNNDFTATDETFKLRALGALSDTALLAIWSMATPATIFPTRKIGSLDAGYEASFITLNQNPLQSFESVRQIAFRFKQGHILAVDITALRESDRPSLVDSLVFVFHVGGLEQMITQYLEWKADPHSVFQFNEFALNSLAFQMLQHEQMAAAERVFRLNVEQYPNSANAWDSMGEFLLKQGKQEAALECYRKVLAVLPLTHYRPEFAKQLEDNARKVLSESEQSSY